MLTLPSSVKLYLATEPTDCRKSFNGLSSLVEGNFGVAATTGDLFVFLNRRGTQVRILFWDRDGFCVLMKKLEAGTFRRVKTAEGAARVESTQASSRCCWKASTRRRFDGESASYCARNLSKTVARAICRASKSTVDVAHKAQGQQE